MASAPAAANTATAATHSTCTATATHGSNTTPGSRKTLELAALLGDAQGIDIAHNGHVYRLQITKAGKLILTK